MRLVLKFGRTDRREGEIKPVEFLYDVIPHVEFASALSGESAGLKASARAGAAARASRLSPRSALGK